MFVSTFLLPSPLLADNFVTPPISFSRVDWRAAVEQLRSEISARPDAAGSLTFWRGRRHRPFDQRRTPALMQLNAITAPIFPAANQSPVPVLLPFDLPGYLADRLAGAPASLPLPRYLAGFRSIDLFEAGPSGYSAVVTAMAGGNSDLPARVFARPVEVHFTGSLLSYGINDPALGKGDAVKSLSSRYPDLRRIIREGFVRYAFTRYGVPYVASIQCLDSVARTNRLSCREASQVAEHFLKSLRIVGGRPARPRPAIASAAVERPTELSPDFTYRPPGELIANSSYRRNGGHPDRTVYAQIRFPIEQAPAYANSQSFMNWGDCYLKGRLPRPHDKGDAYRCRLNDKKLVFDESAPENYSYPWQDNFCETRDFQAGQCPGGFGHQGQDIRPATCTLRNNEADRCVPDRYAAVAVRDGVVIRAPKQQAMTLLVNTRTEHVRFRYMHMAPDKLDADGMVHGKRVSEGERVGVVSNYQGFQGGTTTHLHFDLQVFTRDGWIWVNPYSTLIASYERLLGARGREIAPDLSPPAITAVSETPPPQPASTEGVDDDEN
ncbi:M23 family peptidase [Bradyrhizobium sp. LHD-71]|uniref:M23 family peptidase n=1 Tax=Bradyrhizobium sp. LHD-71 TaxID=3072141 RepID=UPI0035BE66A7